MIASILFILALTAVLFWGMWRDQKCNGLRQVRDYQRACAEFDERTQARKDI